MEMSSNSRDRERRRNAAEQLVRRRPVAGLFTGAKVSLPQALEDLAPHSREIARLWRRLLRHVEASRAEYGALTRMDFRGWFRYVRAGDYDAFRGAVFKAGRTLALQGVPEEQAIMAVGLYLESCLSVLLDAEVDSKKALALTRLTSAAQRLLHTGYLVGQTAGGRADDQERYRLSRDLHDEVGGELVILKLYIETIGTKLEKGKLSDLSAKLEEASVLTSRVIDSVRRLTLDLGPAILEQLGIASVVRIYARQFTVRTGIHVKVQEGHLPEKIPRSHETALYRVLQGALSNVAKHAQARNVKVALGSVRDRVLVMTVQDDGVGFDVPAMHPERAFGLTAIRHRIQSLGGRVHIESRLARPPARWGTRIEIDLPLPGENAS